MYLGGVQKLPLGREGIRLGMHWVPMLHWQLQREGSHAWEIPAICSYVRGLQSPLPKAVTFLLSSQFNKEQVYSGTKLGGV